MNGVCPVEDCGAYVCEGANYSSVLCPDHKAKHYDYEGYLHDLIAELKSALAESKSARVQIADRLDAVLQPFGVNTMAWNQTGMQLMKAVTEFSFELRSHAGEENHG